jgi:putative flippase GtrA
VGAGCGAGVMLPRSRVAWPGDSLGSPHVSVLRGLYARFQHLVHELLKFGVVGAAAFVVDVGMFNVFRLGVGLGPLTSKTLSVVMATTVAYFGNRHWTFRHRGRHGISREYVMFFLLNGVGLGIALTCLWFSHYVLGLRNAVADNIAANVVGLGLGTIFRFWSYRRFVFPHPDELGVASTSASSAEARNSANTGG